MLSIIIPTYNRREMLKQAIESIRVQSYQNFEILIIDDCSNDGTDKLIENYKNILNIKYYRNSINRGPGYNRNFGFKKSKGEFIIFMDDDDYYTDNNYFEKAIMKLEDKNLAFVSANAIIQDLKRNKKNKGKIGCVGKISGMEFLLNLKIKYNKPLSTFTTIFSKEKLLQADLENMKMVNDYAIYLRALLFGDVFIFEKYIGIYRIHGENISNNISLEFLIENLEERAWVKEKLKNKISKFKIKKWWNLQMLILLKYYLFGTNPSYKKMNKIVGWILKKSGISPILWVIMLIIVILYKPLLYIKERI